MLGSLVSTWLPTETASISVDGDDSPTVSVDGVGNASLTAIKNEAGQPTSLMNAPILGLIAVKRADLARSDGSRFAAADMRAWESGGHGSVSPFSWSA